MKLNRFFYEVLEGTLNHVYLLLCGFFVLFLLVLGVVRFYRSLGNRIRQHRLEFLKHFEILNEEMFNRLLKSKASQCQKTMIVDETATGRQEDDESQSSSVTILSLRSSSLDDYRSILDGRQAKSRVMYDLESIVRESTIKITANSSNTKRKKKKRRQLESTRTTRRCNNPKCRKLHLVTRKKSRSSYQNGHEKSLQEEENIYESAKPESEGGSVISLTDLFSNSNFEQEVVLKVL
jgi:hypothetical protein